MQPIMQTAPTGSLENGLARCVSCFLVYPDTELQRKSKTYLTCNTCCMKKKEWSLKRKRANSAKTQDAPENSLSMSPQAQIHSPSSVLANPSRPRPEISKEKSQTPGHLPSASMPYSVLAGFKRHYCVGSNSTRRLQSLVVQATGQNRAAPLGVPCRPLRAPSAFSGLMSVVLSACR